MRSDDRGWVQTEPKFDAKKYCFFVRSFET